MALICRPNLEGERRQRNGRHRIWKRVRGLPVLPELGPLRELGLVGAAGRGEDEVSCIIDHRPPSNVQLP